MYDPNKTYDIFGNEIEETEEEKAYWANQAKEGAEVAAEVAEVQKQELIADSQELTVETFLTVDGDFNPVSIDNVLFEGGNEVDRETLSL